MSNPQHKAYNRTVFVVEGNPLAIVVTNVAGKMTKSHRRFTPEAALAWCRAHRAGLVYAPAENVATN